MTADSSEPKCRHCGQPLHPAVCPTIKAIEYYENGLMKRVEYKTAADYSAPAWLPYGWGGAASGVGVPVTYSLPMPTVYPYTTTGGTC